MRAGAARSSSPRESAQSTGGGFAGASGPDRSSAARDYSTGDQLAVAASIALAVSTVVLLFNATLLFGSKGGPGILAFAKVLLWLSFLPIAAALGIYITSMAGSL